MNGSPWFRLDSWRIVGVFAIVFGVLASLVGVIAVLVGPSATSLKAEERFETLEAIQRITGADGAVRDRNIVRESGVQIVRGVSWVIELKTPDDRYEPVPATREFHTGERFRLRVTTSSRVHCYVLVHNADGSFEVLMPDRDERTTVINPGEPAFVPPSGFFRFAPPAGVDEFWLVASPTPLPFLAPNDLLEYVRKLENGGRLDDEEAAALANLRNQQTRGLKAAAAQFAQTPTAKSLDKLLAPSKDDVRTRGATVVALNKPDHSRLTVVAAPDAAADRPIIEKIKFTHK